MKENVEIFFVLLPTLFKILLFFFKPSLSPPIILTFKTALFFLFLKDIYILTSPPLMKVVSREKKILDKNAN
jgi:hypothetical protein